MLTFVTVRHGGTLCDMHRGCYQTCRTARYVAGLYSVRRLSLTFSKTPLLFVILPFDACGIRASDRMRRNCKIQEGPSRANTIQDPLPMISHETLLHRETHGWPSNSSTPPSFTISSRKGQNSLGHVLYGSAISLRGTVAPCSTKCRIASSDFAYIAV
jgi:hypothetical protein